MCAKGQYSKPDLSACALCRWTSHCEAEWERSDSLALVANITRVQRDKLRDAGIDTMTALAQAQPSPLAPSPGHSPAHPALVADAPARAQSKKSPGAIGSLQSSPSAR